MKLRNIWASSALLVVFIAGGFIETPSTHGQNIAINYNGESPNAGNGFPNGVGVVFTVGAQHLQATELGATGYVSDWNNTTHTSTKLDNNPLTMKLWRVSDGALLGTATLNSADYSTTWFPSNNGYFMPYLSEAVAAPITLVSGVQYQIALYNTSVANFQYINTLDSAAIKPVVSSAITFNQNRYANAGGMIMPNTGDAGATVRYGGPTFEFIARSPAVKWNSSTSGVWDLGSAANWLNTGTSTSDVFLNGDAVTFDDMAGLQTSITLGTTVQPSSVTVNSAVNNYTFSGAGGVGGAASLTKLGTSTLTLGTNNTYTGATTVSAGTLALTGAGSINNSSGITVNGATAKFLTNSSVAVTSQINMVQGTVGGSGAINTPVTIGPNTIVSPGNSPGTQSYLMGQTWAGGGTYLWEIDALTGQGNDSGYDFLDINGTLNISATASSKFAIDINSLLHSSHLPGDVAGFDMLSDYDWVIASADAIALSGADSFSDRFLLDASGFTNAVGQPNFAASGFFSIAQIGNDVVLSYNAAIVPESSTHAIWLLTGLVGLMAIYRRRCAGRSH